MEDEKLTLKQWRQLREMTQSELASKVGVSTNTISLFENKEGAIEKTSYLMLSKLADALNIEVDNIFLDYTWIKSK